MEHAPAGPRTSVARDLPVAVAVVGLTILGEYVFRHYLLFWLPTLGNLLVNDMLALFLAYTLLLAVVGLSLRVKWRQEVRGLARALRECLTSWEYVRWILLMMLGLKLLPVLDRFFWARLTLPILISSYRNPTVLFSGLAPILTPVMMIVVNGLYIPVAEEYLWRGVVQVRLLRHLPLPLAIGSTAILFSLKHALVDASFGRLLTLLAFGTICGIVAQRHSWHSSAAIHMFVNLATTITALILGLE